MTQFVGILNLTPDSFSDGGTYTDVRAMRRAVAVMHAAGARVVDVGAESTRPGASPVGAEAEWERLKPFVEEVMPECAALGMSVSADTRHPAIAARMLERGARWINDVSGFASAGMVQAVRDADCALVMMHSLTVPADPAVTLPEEDVIPVLLAWGAARLETLEKQGIVRGRIIFDPGIGFGKTAAQSWQIIERAGELRALGVPVLVGHSRKSFLGGAAEERGVRTLEVSARLMAQGVDYLRVHDVPAHAVLVKKRA